MTVTALWIPLEVADPAGFGATVGFYRDLLGLPEVDHWARGGERGAVYAAGGTGRIEIVRPAGPGSGPARPGSGPARHAGIPPIALELRDRAAVDALHERLRTGRATTKPETFPRGHYGFTTADPAGHPVLLWSEAAG